MSMTNNAILIIDTQYCFISFIAFSNDKNSKNNKFDFDRDEYYKNGFYSMST